MQNFTDFLDWMRFTAERIAENTSVTWLLKPHPCASGTAASACSTSWAPCAARPRCPEDTTR